MENQKRDDNLDFISLEHLDGLAANPYEGVLIAAKRAKYIASIRKKQGKSQENEPEEKVTSQALKELISGKLSCEYLGEAEDAEKEDFYSYGRGDGRGFNDFDFDEREESYGDQREEDLSEMKDDKIDIDSFEEKEEIDFIDTDEDSEIPNLGFTKLPLDKADYPEIPYDDDKDEEDIEVEGEDDLKEIPNLKDINLDKIDEDIIPDEFVDEEEDIDKETDIDDDEDDEDEDVDDIDYDEDDEDN